jgi:hypothetical protein
MKKNLLLLSIVFTFTLPLMAQPMITANMPPIGHKFSMKIITSTFTHLSSGSNQSWSITPTTTPLLEYEWVAPSSVPQQIQDSFPGTTHTLVGLYGGMQPPVATDMYKLESTQLLYLGQKGSGSSWNPSKPPRIEFEYPASLGSSFTNSGGTSQYDSYGTLNVGGVSFTNVVRFKVYVSGQIDTMFLYAQFTPVYQKLLTYVLDGGNLSLKNKYLYTPLAMNVSELNETVKVNLFPNPVKKENKVFIQTESNVIVNNISVIDISGKRININKPASLNEGINIEMLSTGIYFIEINTNKGMIVKELLVE